MECPCQKRNIFGNYNSGVDDQDQLLIIQHQRSISQMYQYQWRKWSCQDIRSVDQPHVHHLCAQLVLHNTSVARLLWYETCMMAALFSPLTFLRTDTSCYDRTIKRYSCSCYSCLLGFISYTLHCILASSQTCHLRCHVPCSFHPHLRPFPCSVASLRVFRSGYWNFLKMLFFFVCVGISLFFHLLDGGFLFFHYLPRNPLGWWSYLPRPVVFCSPIPFFLYSYLFIVLLVITLPVKDFLSRFFLPFFNCHFQISIIILTLVLLFFPVPLVLRQLFCSSSFLLFFISFSDI